MANFGTLGDLNSYRGSQRPTGLPQWLLDQMSANTTVDEGGGQKTEYSFNNNPFGGFQRDGKNYVQVGSNKLKNPSAITSDPELGDITDVGNVLDINPNGPNYWMLAAALSAGALGTFAGVGAAADAAGAAGMEGAAGLGAAEGLGGAAGAGAGGGATMMNTGLSGLFTGAPQLAPALANGGWEAALAGAGNFGPEAGGLLGGGAGGGAGGGSGLTGATGGGSSSGGLLGNSTGTPWYQSAMNSAMNNPLNTARLVGGLYSMATANNQHPGATGGSSGPGGGLLDTAGMQQFNPMQAQGQFQQNPYLMQAMRNVPFMGGSYGMGY